MERELNRLSTLEAQVLEQQQDSRAAERKLNKQRAKRRAQAEADLAALEAALAAAEEHVEKMEHKVASLQAEEEEAIVRSAELRAKLAFWGPDRTRFGRSGPISWAPLRIGSTSPYAAVHH